MDEQEQKAQAGKAFGLIVVFALIVQAAVTLVWNATGRPSVGLPTPFLSVSFLAIAMIGFALGFKAVYYLKVQPLFEYQEPMDDEEQQEMGE